MSDIIHLLPDALANQIAAGEVIQRPASAVKELLENAIDAGATKIQLIIKDAGKSLIQVIDNGCGMSETDARMCFERHATSKIQSIDDLFNIRTKGFRGEAMASIAAVAQVELKSKRVEDDLGTAIFIEASEVKSQEPCACLDGTSISIKNLFYNVPARRNFLKSNPVETKHIIEEFIRVSLAHPSIAFTLTHNEVEVYNFNSSNLRQRIVSVFGKNQDAKLVPVDEETEIMRVYGFIGKPEAAKKTRGEQYFFANNRFIKNAYLNHAVFNNFSELTTKDTFPFFVLFLDIDPKHIDINVHPTKQEIKFDEEKIVYTMVRVSVQHALSKFSVTPTLDFEQEQSFKHLENKPLTGNFDPNLTGAHAIKGSGSWSPQQSAREKSNIQNWEALYGIDALKSKPHEDALTVESNWTKDEKEADEQAIDATVQVAPYQLHNKYIVSPIKSGFILIDQHAAHERITYERLLKDVEEQTHTTQRQLFPQTINCQAQDAIVLKEIMPELNKMGFDIQEFGNNDFVIHGLPADVYAGNEQQMVDSLIENYKENLSVLKLDKRESLIRSMAQQASLKHGQKLTDTEMRTLIDELFACQQPYVAPNGRLTFITMDFDELNKQFAPK